MDQLTELFIKLLVLSLLTEALTERVKDLMPQKIPSSLIASIIGIGVAVYWEVDLTIPLNHKVDLIGSIVTGFLAARGSNWVNDLTSKFEAFKAKPHAISQQGVKNDDL